MVFGDFYVTFDSAVQRKSNGFLIQNCLWPKWAAIRAVVVHERVLKLDPLRDTDVVHVYACDDGDVKNAVASAVPIASLSAGACRELSKNQIATKALSNPMNAARYQRKIEKLLSALG